MMICPLSVFEELKDKPEKEIRTAIRGYKNQIGLLISSIIAIARFLLTCAFHILNDKVPFDSDKFDELLNKKIKKHNKSVKNTDDMISYLTKLGYSITLQNN